jgi:hypothetical protein
MPDQMFGSHKKLRDWRTVKQISKCYRAASNFSAISNNLVTVFQFLPVPRTARIFSIAAHFIFGRAMPFGK